MLLAKGAGAPGCVGIAGGGGAGGGVGGLLLDLPAPLPPPHAINDITQTTSALRHHDEGFMKYCPVV
jgi:hypothetical protein